MIRFQLIQLLKELETHSNKKMNKNKNKYLIQLIKILMELLILEK